MFPLLTRLIRRLCWLGRTVSLVLWSVLPVHANTDTGIIFNTDVMDVDDRQNIDLSRFSRSGFIMPGIYTMTLWLNHQELSEREVSFYPPDDDAEGSAACLSPELVELLGLRAEITHALTWWHQGQCLDTRSLDRMTVHGDLSTSSLYLSIPQAYLEYSSPNWDPPSRWDDGIPGGLFDYSLNAQTIAQESSDRSESLTGYGTVGSNLGAWRLRADWQARTGDAYATQLDWSRYYAYRALPDLQASMVLGEDYLDSRFFGSFRYAGVNLKSDDNMLPPNLRGYAPEVTGVARTNAKVTVSQQGRVVYEAQVPPGPFRIQDITNAVSGQLDVKVTEQDGSVQSFQVNTANVPYLTRPGRVRYSLTAGRPMDADHHVQEGVFATGEFSWGISNGWSLYGGGIGSERYKAFSLGMGRDLLALGSVGLSATQSYASLTQKGTLSGQSYQASYSKNFDTIGSNITFAGYRFSEESFMDMSDYLDASNNDANSVNSRHKEMYTASFSQQVRSLGLSANFNYNHQTYWDQPDEDRYGLSLSWYFDLAKVKRISTSLSAYRTRSSNGNNDDDMVYLSLSVPWSHGGTVSYNSTIGENPTNTVGYYRRLDDNNNYQLQAGSSSGGATLSGYYSHLGDMADVNVNASYQDNLYSSLGISLTGGATLTAEGGGLHRINQPGGTRLMVGTRGVSGVPVRGNGAIVHTNMLGKAIIPDVNNYYRNKASIDLNTLDDNVEATRSVVQATLTEGAIGYRRFDVLSGEKAMVDLHLEDGSAPPFGAIVLNSNGQETGIVGDGGSVYLSGIKADEEMTVHWGGKTQCVVTPKAPQPEASASVLSCRPFSDSADDR